MTGKVSHKTHILRVIALLFGVLMVLVVLAVHGQIREAGPPSRKPSVTPLLGEGGVPLRALKGSPRTGAVGEKRIPESDTRQKRVAASATGSSVPLFVPGETYTLQGFYADAVAVADLNFDGIPDLVAGSDCASSACAYGSLTVLTGRGDGTFQELQVIRLGGIGANWIAVADVFSESGTDLVVANSCLFDPRTCATGAVTILRNHGDGFLNVDNSYSTGTRYAEAVAVADVNGDHTPDLVVSNCTDSNGCGNSGIGIIGVLLGNGDGTFQPVVNFPSGGVTALSLALVDVNGDGKPDIEVSNECVDPPSCTSGSVAVLLGNGDGTFQAPVNYNSGGQGAGSVAVADVNGDGHPDLLVTIPGSNAVGVLLGNGDGTFHAAVTYGSGGQVPRSVAVSDVDLDGKLDLIVANSRSGLVGVLLGNGDGSFQSAVSYSSLGSSPQKLAVADMNGDGRPDVMVTNLCSAKFPDCNHGSVAALLNNTGPHSPTTTALASNVNPATVSQQVTYTATVTNQSGGPITGSVIFQHGATTTARLVGGQASYSTAYTTTGKHLITAIYSGDTANESSTSATLTEYVGLAPSITSLTTSRSPSRVGKSVTFKAKVTWTYGIVPDGELVTFFDGATAIGTGTTAGGVATFSTASLSAKTHTIKAKYAGDATFKPSTGSVAEVVEQYPTTTSLRSDPNPSQFGQAVTFTAHVRSRGPAPTGKVKFLDGTIAIGSATLDISGVAKLTKSTLTVGTHSITAQYLGDAYSAKSTSRAVNQVVQ